MSFFAQRSIRFWVGVAFMAGAGVALAISAAVGGALAEKGLAMAAFLTALALRFLSYELRDPGFSRGRTLLVAGLLTAILGIGLRLPDRVAAPVYLIGAALVLGGAAGDVWGLWRKRRIAD